MDLSTSGVRPPTRRTESRNRSKRSASEHLDARIRFLPGPVWHKLAGRVLRQCVTHVGRKRHRKYEAICDDSLSDALFVQMDLLETADRPYCLTCTL